MIKNAWCSFSLANVSLTEFGLEIPSPFVRLQLSNSEITSMTSWTLQCTVGGDDKRKMNIAAFEALLYGAAQAASKYPNSSGIPVAFSFGWMNESGGIAEYLSYQGFTLQFKVSTSGLYMQYTLTGLASLAMQSSAPVLRIPELSGFVQPSAVVEALLKAVKATTYYVLDIDHNDNPTYISHGALNTSLNTYIRGSYSGSDDYDAFPGMLKLSKTYSSSRDAAGIQPKFKSLSQILNNVITTPVEEFLKKSNTDTSPQQSSFTYWVDEPTMTRQGVIHYKSTAGLSTSQISDTLRYGTSDTNILSLSGSYSGVAYNITNMSFDSLGFAVDGSGATIISDMEVVNSWSSSLGDVFQTANIVNDLSAIATQFSGDFTVTIPGSTKIYSVAQPVSLLVVTGNTISPVTGIYNIMSVNHEISNSFVTTLKLQRLVVSSANQVAANQGIIYSGTDHVTSGYTHTSNVKTPYKVDFGEVYPTFEHLAEHWTMLL